MIVFAVLLAWCALALLFGTLLAGIARLAAAEDARMDRTMLRRRALTRRSRRRPGAPSMRLGGRRGEPPRAA